MIRVVLDTNVVVSAALQDEGLPAAILDLAVGGAIQLFISEFVFAEYKEILKRPRLKIAPARIARSLALIRKISRQVVPTSTLNVIEQDEPDNRFLECAYAAQADYFVTGNIKHFPKTFERTKILTPREFIHLVLPILIMAR